MGARPDRGGERGRKARGREPRGEAALLQRLGRAGAVKQAGRERVGVRGDPRDRQALVLHLARDGAVPRRDHGDRVPVGEQPRTRSPTKLPA